MTVWWGLAGLLGLLGWCGLLRSHRADGAAVEDDPLARYPVAREPASPNADAAHTPLMTPAITPEMLAQPRPDVPESGSIAGEIPAPRPQTPGEGENREVRVPAVPQGGAPPAARHEGIARPQPPASAVPRQPRHALGPAETPGVPQARPEPETRPVPASKPQAREPEPEPEPEPAAVRHKEIPVRRSLPGSILHGLAGPAKRLLRRN
ncbi:hypothetical protein AB0F15_37515 [Amycolatopsis sp. NPDC026612]|uniref:hypothetical protein n=1 Tax=Amycolatopsis sp. NPDC026612 TaxID=3155466 RepID=UPI0034085668